MEGIGGRVMKIYSNRSAFYFSMILSLTMICKKSLGLTDTDFRYYLSTNADSKKIDYIPFLSKDSTSVSQGDFSSMNGYILMKLTTTRWKESNDLSYLDLVYGAPAYTLLEWQRQSKEAMVGLDHLDNYSKKQTLQSLTGGQLNNQNITIEEMQMKRRKTRRLRASLSETPSIDSSHTNLVTDTFNHSFTTSAIDFTPLTEPFWFHYDSYISVLDGTLDVYIDTFTMQNGSKEKKSMIRGDLLWVRAGTILHFDEDSIMKNVNLTLVHLGGPFDPVYVVDKEENNRRDVNEKITKGQPKKNLSNISSIPLLLPETKEYQDLSYRFYLGDEVKWIPDSHIEGGGGECRDPIPGNSSEVLFPPGSVPDTANGCDGIWQPLTASDPSIFRVHWNQNRQLAAHYHGEGAMYLIYWGTLCFTGERCIQKGEARWVRPGYRYKGEYSKEDGVEIMVLNVDTEPNFDYQPNNDQGFVITKHKATNFVSNS